MNKEQLKKAKEWYKKDNQFKLWSELHPEVKGKIRRSLNWYYFKKDIKSWLDKLIKLIKI